MALNDVRNGIWAVPRHGGADPGRARNCKKRKQLWRPAKASAHHAFIRADIQTDIPISTERQSEELVRFARFSVILHVVDKYIQVNFMNWLKRGWPMLVVPEDAQFKIQKPCRDN